MKVQRHADGSYSITQLTSDDVSFLSGAACTYAAHGGRWTGMTSDEILWGERQRQAAGRLYNVLNVASAMRSTGHIVAKSHDFGIDQDDRYLVTKVHNVRGWHDAEDIAKGLPLAPSE